MNCYNAELVERAMQTFERLDGFGKAATAHALRAKNRAMLRKEFEAQDDWTLEHVTIEEMEYDLSANARNQPPAARVAG